LSWKEIAAYNHAESPRLKATIIVGPTEVSAAYSLVNPHSEEYEAQLWQRDRATRYIN